jgi:hypothetical protein
MPDEALVAHGWSGCSCDEPCEPLCDRYLTCSRPPFGLAATAVTLALTLKSFVHARSLFAAARVSEAIAFLK